VGPFYWGITFKAVAHKWRWKSKNWDSLAGTPLACGKVPKGALNRAKGPGAKPAFFLSLRKFPPTAY
jgi:hypothetical protein